MNTFFSDFNPLANACSWTNSLDKVANMYILLEKITFKIIEHLCGENILKRKFE